MPSLSPLMGFLCVCTKLGTLIKMLKTKQIGKWRPLSFPLLLFPHFISCSSCHDKQFRNRLSAKLNDAAV